MNAWQLKPGDTICINKPGLFANKRGAEAPRGILLSEVYLVVRAWMAQKSEVRWGQVAKTPSKGANPPEACAKVQRLSQISEYGVQSTDC
jgi:hypothetical protein